MSLLNERDQIILVKLETTYGVDSSPNNANALRFSNAKINTVIDKVERNNMTGSLGNQGKITVGKHVELTGEIELAGSGTAGIAPYYGLMLEACAHEVTVQDGVSVTYTPTDVALKSVTIYWRSGNLQHKITGVRGKVEFKLDPKGIPMASFTLMGLYNAPTKELSPVTGIDWTHAKMPIGINKSTTDLLFFDAMPIASSVGFNPGISMEYRNLVNYEGVDLMDRSGDIKLKLQTDDADYIDMLSRADVGDFGNFAYQIGSKSGEVIRVESDNVQISESPSLSYENKIGFFDITCAIVPTDRNSDYRIIFK